MATIYRGSRLLPPVLLLALTIALSSCGSDSGMAAPTKPLTKRQFMNQVETACLKAIAGKEKAFENAPPFHKNPAEASDAEVARFVEFAIVVPYTQPIEQISQLRPAAGDKAAQAIVHGYEKAMKETEADPFGATRLNPFLKPNDLAKAYGIKGCIL